MNNGKETQLIAEVGSVHDGSFGNAIRLVELAKDCGADAIKFQTHLASEETLKDAPSPSFFDSENRYEYFERTSFSREQWQLISDKCDDVKVEFISSPFSIKAFQLLEKIGVKRYKIPSGEVTNIPLLEVIAKTEKPILLSSGMSTWKELDLAVKTIIKYNENLTILQCTSEYPCKYDNVGINVMLEMKQRYNLPIGFSDHTLTNFAAFLAVSYGATAIEKHLTFSREMYGSDAKHSSEPDEFKELSKGIKAINTIIKNKVNKSKLDNNMLEMKTTFEKSIVTLVDIPKGTMITKEMLGLKKPGTGLPSSMLTSFVGKKTNVLINKDYLIKLEDI